MERTAVATTIITLYCKILSESNTSSIDLIIIPFLNLFLFSYQIFVPDNECSYEFLYIIRQCHISFQRNIFYF